MTFTHEGLLIKVHQSDKSDHLAVHRIRKCFYDIAYPKTLKDPPSVVFNRIRSNKDLFCNLADR